MKYLRLNLTKERGASSTQKHSIIEGNLKTHKLIYCKFLWCKHVSLPQIQRQTQSHPIQLPVCSPASSWSVPVLSRAQAHQGCWLQALELHLLPRTATAWLEASEPPMSPVKASLWVLRCHLPIADLPASVLCSGLAPHIIRFPLLAWTCSADCIRLPHPTGHAHFPLK